MDFKYWRIINGNNGRTDHLNTLHHTYDYDKSVPIEDFWDYVYSQTKTFLISHYEHLFRTALGIDKESPLPDDFNNIINFENT